MPTTTADMIDSDGEKQLDALLTEYAIEHPDWPETPDELDQYLGGAMSDATTPMTDRELALIEKRLATDIHDYGMRKLVKSAVAEVRRLREAQRWVSVDEALPKEFQTVEIIEDYTSIGGSRFFATAQIEDGKWRCGKSEINAAFITHWRMPELPLDQATAGRGREQV